jgi:thiol:disulfide interchange protein DsbD
MGFSMLGLFEITMPNSVTQKMATQKSGYFGALGVGLTIGFVAAPCVAPILVIMLTWIATSQNLFLGFILMFAYAIGMGLLFIVVGTFSNAVLPRSGMWMVWLKKIFAFVFFIMAVIYAQSLLEMVYGGLSFYVIGALLVLLGTVMGAFNPTSKDSGWWEMIGKSLGLLAVVTGLVFFAGQLIKPMLPATVAVQGSDASGQTAKAEPNWTTDFQAGLAKAAETGKPLLVDVWATWCIACHELDELTFSDPRVMEEMNSRFVLVKIDGTSESDPAYRAVKEHFAARGYPIVGLPAVFIHDSQGNIVEVINQFQSADVVLPKLQAVK